MRDLKGKTALVTGAGRGIGRAVAVALARCGIHVALVSRTESELLETSKRCKEFGVKTLVLPFDLSRIGELPKLMDRVVSELGPVQILVNNAGMSVPGRCGEADLEKWDLGLDLNVRALMHMTRLAIPQIEKSPWGAVINIASIAGKQAIGSAAYTATKHAVVGFTAALFEDVREKNIKVCAIFPAS